MNLPPAVLTRRALLGSTAVGGLLAASGSLSASAATAPSDPAPFRLPGLRHSPSIVRAAARQATPAAWALQPFP